MRARMRACARVCVTCPSKVHVCAAFLSSFRKELLGMDFTDLMLTLQVAAYSRPTEQTKKLKRGCPRLTCRATVAKI